MRAIARSYPQNNLCFWPPNLTAVQILKWSASPTRDSGLPKLLPCDCSKWPAPPLTRLASRPNCQAICFRTCSADMFFESSLCLLAPNLIPIIHFSLRQCHCVVVCVGVVPNLEMHQNVDDLFSNMRHGHLFLNQICVCWNQDCWKWLRIHSVGFAFADGPLAVGTSSWCWRRPRNP